MKKIKFYQIVIKDDPRSEEYHQLSQESFKCVEDIIEIVRFDAITPSSLEFKEHESKYNWSVSKMLLDNMSKQKQEHIDQPHSPTERAGMCSHWELMRMKGLTEERFWVTEHDTYLIPKHEDVFRTLVERVETHRHEYANIGLFMGCYSLSSSFAHYGHHLLAHHSRPFPINGGPYGCMERLYKTYLDNWYFKNRKEEYLRRQETYIHPWAGCDRLHIGKSDWEIRMAFNFFLDKHRPNHDFELYYPTPTTQMIKKDLKVTQDHREYPKAYQSEPWKRHRYFHIID